MKLKQWILCSLLGLGAGPALACYTVYDRSDRVVYQSQTPPVDMSRPLHQTVPARFPGGHMIFDTAAQCQVISSVAMGTGGRTLSSVSPLLTEPRTARDLGLPHTVLARGVALVQQRNLTLAPGLTVLPARGSAIPSTAVMGAAPSGAVITELRDPPMTIEQWGDRVILREPAR